MNETTLQTNCSEYVTRIALTEEDIQRLTSLFHKNCYNESPKSEISPDGLQGLLDDYLNTEIGNSYGQIDMGDAELIRKSLDDLEKIKNVKIKEKEVI